MANFKSREAARLKDEGNKHFEKKEFSQAYDKYTAALARGGENAILYSNRAACLLGRRKFLDAEDDAVKATEIDPAYSKGWGRLAAAYMGQTRIMPAISAFQKAIDNLPDGELSASQRKQKQQYEDGIRDARSELDVRKRNAPEVVCVSVGDLTDDRPWTRALRMIKLMDPAHSTPTSAWVIGRAYEDWLGGMERLKQLKQSKFADGTPAWSGSHDVYQFFTNAILRDHRIFQMQGSWLADMEKQALFETRVCNGWDRQGPKEVLNEAQERVARYGWEGNTDGLGVHTGGTRKAIATRVRIWILRAFMTKALAGNGRSAESLFQDIVDFLEEGRKIWANVPRDDRGTVFDDTFVRGVRVLHLEAFLSATMLSMGDKYTLKALLEMAENLRDQTLVENETSTSTVVDPGFAASFHLYPIGAAVSTMALCYRKMAMTETNKATKKSHLRMAGQLYHQSIQYFCDDDERCSYFLVMSLGAYWHSDTDLNVTLPLMKLLCASAPRVKKIWEHSVTVECAGNKDGPVALCLAACKDVFDKISSGELNENSPYKPGARLMKLL